ncbi:MAG: hypothetical protein LUD68_04870 [Rikenellaceae bacterium]|nr:hypothetical protein [Rikenellaceae bacterium]
MKKIIACMTASVLLFTACQKEGKLQPSGLDRDWFSLEDSSDPVEHLRYEIFAATGVPVFSNDTLGSINLGTDRFGQPWVYYEVLKPDYWLTSAVTADNLVTSYELSYDREAIRQGLEFFRDRIFPALPEIIYPRSFLMTGRLYRYGTGEFQREFPAMRGWQTTVTGYLDEIAGMTDRQLDYLTAQILAVQYASYVMANFDEAMQEFYEKTYFFSINGANYLTIYGARVAEDNTTGHLPYQHYHLYGVLSWDFSQPASFVEDGTANWHGPSIEQDVTDYLTEVLFYGEDAEAFAEVWPGEEYALIREKYDRMLEVFQQVQASFEE